MRAFTEQHQGLGKLGRQPAPSRGLPGHPRESTVCRAADVWEGAHAAAAAGGLTGGLPRTALLESRLPGRRDSAAVGKALGDYYF